MTPSPLFNFNFVLLQTRLLSLQTTTLHFLIVTNKRYNFNFCPCLSLWTRLSNFSFCMHNICPFGLQLLQRSLSLQLSQPLALQCFRFVQLSALSLSLWLSFPFNNSASHFFCPLICFLISHLFLLVQFNSAVLQNPDVAIHVPKASVK